MHRLTFTILRILFLLPICLGQAQTVAQEAANDLVPEPGKTMRISFPDLPPTLLAMTTGNEIPAAVLVRIPDNYNQDDKFPLYVFLEGGNGGAGSNIGVPMRISNGGDGVIVASFPLFKTKYDEKQRWPFVVGFEDVETVSTSFKVIMDKLRTVIPNMDAERSIIGGHSNGAKTLAILLSSLDDNLLKSFHGIFFVDGGFFWSSNNRPVVLKNHHILFLAGEREEHGISSNWRKHILNRMEYFRTSAKHLGMKNWRFKSFHGVGHEFAERYFTELSDWAQQVRGPIPDNK